MNTNFFYCLILITITLIYIIIVCKQTSAYHKSSDLPYSKKTRVFFKLIYFIKIYNLYFLFLYIIIKVKIPYKRTKNHSEKFVKLKIFLILILILPAARW